MTTLSRRVLAAVLAPTLGACTLAGPAVPGQTDRCAPTRGHQMVTLVNQMREREGLFPLRVDRRLAAAAQAHAEDMAEHAFVGHDGSDGSLTAYRVDQQRYPWVRVLENTAGGLPTAAATFASWQESPGHHRNNVDEVVEHIGVGYAENAEGRHRTYWVVVFGASTEAPLSPPGGCHA